MRYRVEVCRIVKDIEYGFVNVDAVSKHAAKKKALDIVTGDNSDFWSGVKSTPVSSCKPYVDEVTEVK